jgi:hypothetical protein
MDGSGSLKRTAQMVGAAGVHYVVSELLKHGIVSAVPFVDSGYDLITDAGGLLRRIQIKAELLGDKMRPRLDQLRYSLRRRKQKRLSLTDTVNQDQKYTADMIDAMIFVTFRHQMMFIVPAAEIDFNKDWIHYQQLRRWENAVGVLAGRSLEADA